MKRNDILGDISNVIEELKENGVQMCPTTLEDLEAINSLTNRKHLPKAYLEYYKYMGNGVSFFKGHSCFKNEIFKVKTWAEELLNENKVQTKLSENDFVFWISQGYMFCFFKLDEGDDPPVYYYCEGEGKGLSSFYKIAESFSLFLYRMYKYDRDLFKISI